LEIIQQGLKNKDVITQKPKIVIKPGFFMIKEPKKNPLPLADLKKCLIKYSKNYRDENFILEIVRLI